MKKKVLSLALAGTMLLGSVASAAEMDIVNKNDNTRYSFENFIDDPLIFDDIIASMNDFLIEGEDGNLYSFLEVSNKIENEDKTFNEAVAELTPVVEEGLVVESVSAINNKTISVTFEGVEEAVEIELDEALVDGQTKVTFVYKDVTYTEDLDKPFVEEEPTQEEKLEAAKEAVQAAEKALEVAEEKLLDEQWIDSTHGGNYENVLIAEKEVEAAKKVLKEAKEALEILEGFKVLSVGEVEDIAVEFGGEYTLPSTVSVNLSNDTVIKVPVIWDDSKVNVEYTASYKVEGTLDLSGLENVADTDLKATVNVIVGKDEQIDLLLAAIQATDKYKDAVYVTAEQIETARELEIAAREAVELVKDEDFKAPLLKTIDAKKVLVDKSEKLLNVNIAETPYAFNKALQEAGINDVNSKLLSKYDTNVSFITLAQVQAKVDLVNTLETALDGQPITLKEDIKGDITINNIVELDLGGKTIDGNVTINTTSIGTIKLENGTISGNLTVNAPNANGIIEENLTVTGAFTLNGEVQSKSFFRAIFSRQAQVGSWTVNGTVKEVVSNLENAEISINNNVEKVTLNKKATVKVAEEVKVENIEITSEAAGARVENNGTITQIKADAEITLDNKEGAKVTTVSGNSKVDFEGDIEGVENVVGEANGDLEAAREVAATISSLPTNNNPLENGEALVAAQKAFNDLTDAQKALVTNEETLTKAVNGFITLAKGPANGAVTAVTNEADLVKKQAIVDEAKAVLDTAENLGMTQAEYDHYNGFIAEAQKLVNTAKVAKIKEDVKAALPAWDTNATTTLTAVNEAIQGIEGAKAEVKEDSVVITITVGDKSDTITIKGMTALEPNKENKAAAEAATTKITTLSNSLITDGFVKDALKSGGAIKEAKAAYDALNDAAKGLVSADNKANLDKLVKEFISQVKGQASGLNTAVANEANIDQKQALVDAAKTNLQFAKDLGGKELEPAEQQVNSAQTQVNSAVKKITSIEPTIVGTNDNTLNLKVTSNFNNLEVTDQQFKNALNFQMRNVARIDDALVVYTDGKDIVGVLANGNWTAATSQEEYSYKEASLVEAKDLTLEEVTTYVDTRFKEENKSASVNSEITVTVDENGNVVVVFPSDFINYVPKKDGNQMNENGYNVTAHLDYSELFGEKYVGEATYSFKIKSYLSESELGEKVVLEELK